MSKKRKSPESSNDEQSTLEGSDSFQREGNTKRARLHSLSDTTLQDLPVEVIECILVKAVAMEVKAMKLVKSVWKAKAEMVISRLRTVSLQWSSILSTNFFRNELHRTLDGYVQETIRWEILPQPSNQRIWKLTTLRDEVFMICEGSGLNVYDRNNMAQAKDVIPLPQISLGDMVACSVSNCVYILNVERDGPSIIRIMKDEHQFKVSVLIKNLRIPRYARGPLSVGLSPNGSLIILSDQASSEPAVVGIYDANGFVQHEIRLSPAVYGFTHVSRVIQKANGNLVLVCHNDQYNAKLSEIDTSGSILREYQSSFRAGCSAEISEDIYGRILVNYLYNKIELLDSEFNLLDIAVPRLVNPNILTPFQMHYNSERHEMVGFYTHWDAKTSVLVTIRYAEE